MALGCLFAAVGVPAVHAHAQPSLEGAERALENADFERALTDLEALAADESLGLAAVEVARLLRLRAVAAAALGRDDDARTTLRALSTLLAGAEPGALPPALRALYTEVRSDAPLNVQVSLVRDVGGQVRAAVSVRDDPASLVRYVVLRCAVGEREVARTRGDRLVVREASGLRCAATAVGPGGYVLAEHEVPWVASGSLEGEDDWNPYEEPPPRRVGAIVGGVLAGVVVVAGVIALAVVLGGRGTTLDGPTWEEMP